MNARIVIVGGGLAGTTLVRTLLKKKAPASITLIEPKEYIEVPFAQLRALTDPTGFARVIRKSLKEMLPEIEVIRGRATSFGDGKAVISDGGEIEFDWLVLATGSSFSRWPFLKGSEETAAEREAAFVTEGNRIESAKSVLIIGGGPIGVELAGEIAAKPVRS